MSQPQKYSRTHSFTQELGNQHGINLDEEFNDIQLTLFETDANLALIQRDDTKLANASVHPNALDSATLALIASTFTPRSEWATLTGYVIGDIVEVGSTGSYVAAVAHTSGATFALDKAAGKWNTLARTPLTGSVTFNPSNLVDGDGETTTVTVTGASLGDRAEASFSLDLQGVMMTTYVSATNTVSVRFQNETGGTINLASGTLRAWATPN